MKKPEEKPISFCLAPWVHTYCSPVTERRLCCASREQARSFTQYIDATHGEQAYAPQTLAEHWNSEGVRAVRRKMMNGEVPPECEVCNTKILNTDVYRDYFWHLFRHKYDEVWAKTDETGYTTMEPVSWDYRFSNLCNFKCRMCGDMLSSSWESEQKQHQMVDLTKPKNRWMLPEVRSKITEFHDTVIEQEFATAVEEHRIEEVYWVGGEPLMYEQHWRYMRRIIELGDGHRVYARYNSNLSRVDYQGVNLYRDILAHLRDWQICASLDATGAIGEYIRTGLQYPQWLLNYQQGCAIQRHPRQMRIDFTLTLPGLFDLANIVELSKSTGTGLLAKVVFAFGPDILMSPLAMPRTVLEPIVNNALRMLASTGTADQRALVDVLENLLRRPTFAEQWPDSYQLAAQAGKQRILQLERIRTQPITMREILSTNTAALEWWDSIDV